jgi:hypothetical protein
VQLAFLELVYLFHPRRVVMKAEVTVLRGLDPRDNPRFVITNLKGSSKMAVNAIPSV